jgi:hypothetical protein
MVESPSPTQLGRYQLVRALGRGAMGVVYEARDPKLERTVAVKTILKGHLLDAAMAGEYSARFVREAQAVARLAHPNIVTVFDFGEQDDIAYLVMEFIRGRELAALLEEGRPLAPARAVTIVEQLLAALSYAHERGVVHRDVKPANVMIDDAGHVKLTDFGVARLADAGAERTLPGTMVGTPSYMSPEQIQGLAVGSRTDLFAAGVVLYQLLTGHKPFAGDTGWAVQKQIVQEEPAPPSSLVPGLARGFDVVVARALAKRPDARFASAADFAAALRQAGADDPEATVVRRAPAVPRESPPAHATAVPTGTPWLRRRRVGVAAGAAGVIGAVAAGFALMPRGGPPIEPPPSAALVPPPAPAATLPETAAPPPPAPASQAQTALMVTATASAPSPAVERARPAASRPADPLAARAVPTAAERAAAIRTAAARCADLLQRFQVGDNLSAKEQQTLQEECRR